MLGEVFMFISQPWISLLCVCVCSFFYRLPFFSCMSQKLIQLLWHFMAVLFIRDQRSDASSVNLAQAGSFAARNRERGTKHFDNLTPLVRVAGPGVSRRLCPHHWWRKCKVLITFCFVCVQERRNKLMVVEEGFRHNGHPINLSLTWDLKENNSGWCVFACARVCRRKSKKMGCIWAIIILFNPAKMPRRGWIIHVFSTDPH